MNNKPATRTWPYLYLLLAWGGIVGLCAWEYLQMTASIQRDHERWAQHIAQIVVAERQSLISQVDTMVLNDFSQIAHVNKIMPDIIGAVWVDQKSHTNKLWHRPGSDLPLLPLDPRLGVLEINAMQSRQTQAGPLLSLKGQSLNTVVRPVDADHVVILYLRSSNYQQLIEEEARLWHVKCLIFNFEGRQLFGDFAGMEGMTKTIIDLVRAGTPSGHASLPSSLAWHWFATYHYDKACDWIFVVFQWLPWVYAPLILFGLGMLGMIVLIRIPYKAAAVVQQRLWSHALSQFAFRADSYIHGRETTLRDPDGSCGELLPVVQALRWAMPQWKKAESIPKELGLERRLLALLIESLPEAILFFNAQGGLQMANELGRVFLGLQQEVGKETKMVNGIQVARGFLEPFLEPVLTGGQANLGKEVEVAWADGKRLYRIWVERVEGEPGMVLGFVTVIRDITFRKQWEQVQEQVLSGITHDLRGPLSAVMGYIDLSRRALGDGAPPKVIEYLKMARDGGTRLSQMVSDILDVVRFEQGKVELEPQSFPVSEVFTRLQNTFGVLAEQKKVALKVQASDAFMTAWGDRKLIDRVLDNLVGNAIKFTPPNGSITVSCLQGPGRLQFQVQDTGRGIPREAQSRIFDKFQQVRPGDRSNGYGLGLAVTKFIVEAHKGEIRVESEVGVGSAFIFWIPEKPAGAVEPNNHIDLDPNTLPPASQAA